MMHEHAILCIGISIRATLLSVGNSLLNMGLDYCDFSVMYRQFTIIYEMKWKTTFFKIYTVADSDKYKFCCIMSTRGKDKVYNFGR